MPKFYCPSSGAAPITPNSGNDHSSWGQQGAAFNFFKATIVRGTTALTTKASGSHSQSSDCSGFGWVYGPLKAGTITGTLDCQVRGRSSVFSNVYHATMAAWIAKPDGTVRGTLVNASDVIEATQWGTAYANYVAASATCSSVTVTAGDYLVMEVGTTADFLDVENFDIEIGENSSTNHCYFDFTDVDLVFWAPAGLSYTTPLRFKRGKAITTQSPSSTGGPVASYAVQTGSLPPGLSLNSSSGDITGTPTQSGTYTFTIRATNEGGTTDSGSIVYTVYAGNNIDMFKLYTTEVNL